MIGRSRSWTGALCAAALFAGTGAARADVEREGTWPEADPAVTLDLDATPRNEAITKLAKAAGWSVVMRAPDGDKVSLHVQAQPADKVLEMLLGDGDWVVLRKGNLLSISPAPAGHRAPAPPAPPVPPAPPALPPPVPPAPPHADEVEAEGVDRSVTGGNLRIEKGEVVRDVTVTGGNLDVWGTVTGDLSVMGGNVHLHRGARVRGDAAAFGGNVEIEADASIDGDVDVLGGDVRREPGSRIGGAVREGVTKIKDHKDHAKKAAKSAKVEVKSTAAPAKGPGFLRSVSEAVNRAALLFVCGSVLTALFTDRMDKLKLQVASRPMRTFATGVVSLIGGAVLFAAMCVTVVGIPVAAVLAIAAILGTLAGVCATLETVGAALLGHRTKNPYVHLAAGAALFVIAGLVPRLGDVVGWVVIVMGLGSFVASRAAGFIPAKHPLGSPYRDASLP
jgi:hypothetical protein